MIGMNVGALLALASIPQVVQGQVKAQAASCIPQADAQQLFVYALPEMFAGIVKKCGPSLPRTAFLNRSEALLASYRTRGEQAWPQAKATFLAMAGPAMRNVDLPDSALRPLVAAMLSSMAGNEIKANDCPVANDVAESLAPLPQENLARLIVVVAARDTKPGERSEMPICRN